MKTLAIEQFQSISFSENVRSVERIEISVSDAQRRVLDARLAAHEAHPRRGRTWEEIKAGLAPTHASTV